MRRVGSPNLVGLVAGLGNPGPGAQKLLKFKLFFLVQRLIPGLVQQAAQSLGRVLLGDQACNRRFEFGCGCLGIRDQSFDHSQFRQRPVFGPVTPALQQGGRAGHGFLPRLAHQFDQ